MPQPAHVSGALSCPYVSLSAMAFNAAFNEPCRVRFFPCRARASPQIHVGVQAAGRVVREEHLPRASASAPRLAAETRAGCRGYVGRVPGAERTETPRAVRR